MIKPISENEHYKNGWLAHAAGEKISDCQLHGSDRQFWQMGWIERNVKETMASKPFEKITSLQELLSIVSRHNELTRIETNGGDIILVFDTIRRFAVLSAYAEGEIEVDPVELGLDVQVKFGFMSQANADKITAKIRENGQKSKVERDLAEYQRLVQQYGPPPPDWI